MNMQVGISSRTIQGEKIKIGRPDVFPSWRCLNYNITDLAVIRHQFLCYMLFKYATSKSFQESVTPGKHQCMQSSCFFPPALEGWASALDSLMCVISRMRKLAPLRALYRCRFTSRASPSVPLFSKAKKPST